MNRAFLLPTLLMASLGLASVSHAQVYKWVDASGHVHFGDQAPPDQKADMINLPEVEPATVAPDVSDEERRQRQQRLIRAMEDDRHAKEEQKALAKAELDKKRAYCERFRNRMERLEASSLVYSENDDGTVTYWKEGDAERFKIERRAQYKQECGDQ